MMSLGDSAAKLNLPVFPCAANKRPVVENGFKSAATDPAHIIAAFDRPGAALIGVPTGRMSGWVVVDVDIKNGARGQDWLDENSNALPPTRTHKTRSGGLHLVFQNPSHVEIRNSASRVAPGVDVRAEGGYVIVPPSDGYTVADHTEPAEMPLWLIRACMRPEPERAPVAPSTRPSDKYVGAAVDGEVLAVMRAPEGTRNHQLNVSAVKLGSLVSAGLLSRSTAEAELYKAAIACGLDHSEIGPTIKSGLEFGAQSPRQVREREYRHHETTPPPPDIYDDGYWAAVEQSMTAEEWRDLEQREAGETIPASPQATEAAGPDVLWILNEPWEEADIPTRPWIARGYLMRRSVTVVSGPGSAGKSSLMVAWASALALGSAFSRMKCVGQMRVATYNVEDDEDEQKRRFSAMAQRLGIHPRDFGGRLAILGPQRVGTLLQIGRDGGPLLNTPVMDRLEKFVEEFAPDILILDPFVELHGAEENDNTAVRAVMARLRAMAVEYNMSVVILHHARKGAGDPGDPDSLRGASSIVGAARVVLTLNVMTEEESQQAGLPTDRRRNFFRLDGAKSNYAPIEEAEWFERQERELANGDGVAIAWPWKPPSVFRDLTPDQINSALNQIADGYSTGVLYRPSQLGGSSPRWVGNVLMKHGLNEEQAKKVVKAWLKSGLLVETQYRDMAEGKMRPGVIVDDAKRP